MSSKKKSGLVRRAKGLMALEPRYIFDGAAVTNAIDTVDSTDTGFLHFINSAEKSSSVLNLAQQQVNRTVSDFLQRADVTQQFFALFNGNKTQMTSEWEAAANALIAKLSS